MFTTKPSSLFRSAALAAVIGASALAGFPALAQQTSAPVKNIPGVTLKKLTDAQCKFMADRAVEMVKSFDPNHFSREFKISIGNFTTRNFDCSGPPVFKVMTQKDDFGIVMIGKFMFDNKQGEIYDSVYIYDPNGIADFSQKFRPKQVLRVLPPEFASTGPASGPGG